MVRGKEKWEGERIDWHLAVGCDVSLYCTEAFVTIGVDLITELLLLAHEL